MSALPQPKRCQSCGALYDRDAKTNEAMVMAHLVAMMRRPGALALMREMVEVFSRHMPGVQVGLERVIADEHRGGR